MYLLHVDVQDIQLFQHHLLKRPFFSPYNYLGTLAENQLTVNSKIYFWTLSWFQYFMSDFIHTLIPGTLYSVVKLCSFSRLPWECLRMLTICINFLWLLLYISTNLVALNNRIFLSYSSVGHKSHMDSPKSRCRQLCVPPWMLQRRILFFCLF